jgi:hypothetical protein
VGFLHHEELRKDPVLARTLESPQERRDAQGEDWLLGKKEDPAVLNYSLTPLDRGSPRVKPTQTFLLSPETHAMSIPPQTPFNCPYEHSPLGTPEVQDLHPLWPCPSPGDYAWISYPLILVQVL